MTAATVCLFDPGLQNRHGAPSHNLGDVIIQQAVTRECATLFPGADIVRIATHEYPTGQEIDRALASDWLLVGGSNIVASYAWIYREWKLHPWQIARLRGRVILFGCGWGWYQPQPTLPARWMLQTLLSRQHTHSVRDGYTQRHLAALGFDKVINTACPTLWPLAKAILPTAKSDDVLVMLTDYRPDLQSDQQLLALAHERYARVHIWYQGARDEAYAAELRESNSTPLHAIPHDYARFEDFLANGPAFDYIGTRLHGGIRCMLAGRRALIVEVDNRATEMARDVGLPTAKRGDIAAIDRWIDDPQPVALRLPVDAIGRWRAQFARA
jgi:polysaccharide pyruvyl transferase WcaK-like protein